MFYYMTAYSNNLSTAMLIALRFIIHISVLIVVTINLKNIIC